MITSTPFQQIATPVATGKANFLKKVRQLHLYLGVFFAPAIIFFSFTGALQLFGLHEGHPGEAYQPPKWIAALASIHKDQVLSKHHGPPQGFETRAEAKPQTPGLKSAPAGKSTLLLKYFFLAMSIGLIITTLLGIYMAFKYNRSRALLWGLLVAGAALPSGMIALLA